MKNLLRIIVMMMLSFPVYSGAPGQVNFQGLLLDDVGQVINGSANFDFSLFDSATGGAQLWTESQSGVAVSAGKYTVALGSVVPLTTGLLSGSEVYLEITVNGDILSPRQRLLAVPYALKAEEADYVAGVSGIFVQQLYQNLDWDGQSIPNDDPREGVDDVDADGLSNFMDPDNDNDGVSDDTEIANGTDVNLITPAILSIDGPVIPTAAARVGELTTMTISGSNFLAGVTVQVGAETPVPQNLTSSSFDITVGSGQIAGPVTVTVSNTNSEVATGQMHFYEKLVFLSQNKGAAALNQTTATATAFCAQAAANAGLTGSYVAWYSDSKNSDSAIDHFPPAGGPWSRPDGVLVASDLADLTDGNINAAIYIDEYGNDNSSISIVVATNTDISGNFKPDQCTGDPVTDTGTAGSRNRTDSAWTFSTNKSCNAILSYYCFEE